MVSLVIMKLNLKSIIEGYLESPQILGNYITHFKLMGQKKSRGKLEKILRGKIKRFWGEWSKNIPKFVGWNKGNAYREIYSI